MDKKEVENSFLLEFSRAFAISKKIQDNNGQFKITIPKFVSNLKGWDQGTLLSISLDKNSDVVIKEFSEQKKLKSKKKLQNNNGQFRLTIPKKIALSKFWSQGTEVIITLNKKGEVVIRNSKNEITR